MLVECGIDLTDGRLQPLFIEARAKIEVHDGVVSGALQALTEGETFFFKRGGELVENRIQ